MLNDRQAEPRSAGVPRPRLIHTIEPFKDAGEFVGWDSITGIGYCDSEHSIHHRPGNANLPAGLVVMNGVVDEVRKGCRKTGAIGMDSNCGTFGLDSNVAIDDRIPAGSD